MSLADGPIPGATAVSIPERRKVRLRWLAIDCRPLAIFSPLTRKGGQAGKGLSRPVEDWRALRERLLRQGLEDGLSVVGCGWDEAGERDDDGEEAPGPLPRIARQRPGPGDRVGTSGSSMSSPDAAHEEDV